jgi:hypothetical protein
MRWARCKDFQQLVPTRISIVAEVALQDEHRFAVPHPVGEVFYALRSRPGHANNPLIYKAISVASFL